MFTQEEVERNGMGIVIKKNYLIPTHYPQRLQIK